MSNTKNILLVAIIAATIQQDEDTPVDICVDPSLLSTILPPAGGVCVPPLVAATIAIAGSRVNVCVSSNIFE